MNYPAHFSPFSLRCQRGAVTFQRPAVMGILNATADSFYDGGRYNNPDALLAHARELLQQGADIIDLGVMSSRPGAAMLSPADEADKLAPLVALLRAELPDALLSVDTCQSLPAARAVEAGADIVNDISGGQLDPDMLATVASLHAANMDLLLSGDPDINIYTVQGNNKILSEDIHGTPQFIGKTAKVKDSLINQGSIILGEVDHSVISGDVVIEEGAKVTNSVVMNGAFIDQNAVVTDAIIGPNTLIEKGEKVNVEKDGIALVVNEKAGK